MPHPNLGPRSPISSLRTKSNCVSGSSSTVCNLPFTLREILLTANLLSASWGSIVTSHSSCFVDVRCSGGEGSDSGRGTANAGAFYCWRRGRDLNPRYPLRYVRFRGGSFQPLTHLSAPWFTKAKRVETIRPA